jgi:hypothetical protein
MAFVDRCYSTKIELVRLSRRKGRKIRILGNEKRKRKCV